MKKTKTKVKTKTKKRKPIDKSSMSILLNGEVFLVETDKKGKETLSPIDGKIVVNCILACLERAMDRLESEITKEKETKEKDLDDSHLYG